MSVMHTNYGPHLRVTVSPTQHDRQHVLWSVVQRMDNRPVGYGTTYPASDGIEAGLVHAREVTLAGERIEAVMDNPNREVREAAVRTYCRLTNIH